MSDDLRVGGRGGEPALADERLTDPAFLVTADPEEVMALTAVAAGPAARLAVAVYRASARAHHDADAATRRQILAVDAARFGDRDLSERIAAVEVPDAPAVRWRVEWATGQEVHPGFLGFLDDSDGGWPRPVVAVDGRPAVITLDDSTMVFRDLATGEVVGQAPVTSSAADEEETTAVVDGRPVTVSYAGPDGPRVLDPSTGQLLGVLPRGDNSQVTGHVESVTIEGRPHAVAGDGESVAVWDLTTREVVCEMEPDDGDDLLSWVVVAVDGRPHVVTGSYEGRVEVWDAATGERIDGDEGDDRSLELMAAVTIDGRPHVLTIGCDEYVGNPLHTANVWSVDPLQCTDWLPDIYPGENLKTAALGDCCLVTDGNRVWELSGDAGVGHRALGHAGAVTAAATTVLDGRPVAITGGEDETLEIRDLATGRLAGSTMSADKWVGEYDGVTKVRTAVVDGHPYAVTEHDGPAVRVWDLATRLELTGNDRPAEIIESMTDGDRLVPAEVLLLANGRTYMVTVGPDSDSAVRFRAPDTGQEIDDTPFGPAHEMTAFATGTVGGRPVAVVATRRRVRVWDVAGDPATVIDELVFPHAANAVAITPEGGILVGFGNEVAMLSRR